MSLDCSLHLATLVCPHGLDRHSSFMMPLGSVHTCQGTPSGGSQHPLAPILHPAMASILWSVAMPPADSPKQKVTTMVAGRPLRQSLLSDFIDTLARSRLPQRLASTATRRPQFQRLCASTEPGAHVAHWPAGALQRQHAQLPG